MKQKIRMIDQIFEMLNLFYANKHIYEKLRKERIRGERED